jgi:transcriptional regulator with XRE-family HTH domain
MKLGDVLRRERERTGLQPEEVAARLGMPAAEYAELEAGISPAEEWGPKLGRIAVALKTPTSRLISETGSSSDAQRGASHCGELIKQWRERSGLTQQALATSIDVPLAEVVAVENGKSPLEIYAPLLLGFAEVVGRPIFNLFYPGGLPLDRLAEYQ